MFVRIGFSDPVKDKRGSKPIGLKYMIKYRISSTYIYIKPRVGIPFLSLHTRHGFRHKTSLVDAIHGHARNQINPKQFETRFAHAHTKYKRADKPGKQL
jgi:hypothetical protein